MGNDTQLSTQHLCSALNLVPDLILVASSSLSSSSPRNSSNYSSDNNNNNSNNNSNDNNNNNIYSSPRNLRIFTSPSQFHQQENCTSILHDKQTCKCKPIILSSILFLNNPLLTHLGYKKDKNKDNKEEEEEKDKEFDYSEMQGSVRGIIWQDDQCHCRISLDNANNSNIDFFATGTIEENVFIFKLRMTEFDETALMRKIFYSLDVFMTVMELGPPDGTYEWRHIVPNSYVKKANAKQMDTMFTYEASKRHSVEHRKQMHDACMESKQTGIQTPRVPEEGLVALMYSRIAYLETSPYTNNDLYGLVIWDALQLKIEVSSFKELMDFFENAPMMMGLCELKGGEMYVIHTNKLMARFCGSDKPIPKGTKWSAVRAGIDSNDITAVYTNMLTESRNRQNTVMQELQMLGPDGKVKYLQATFAMISYDKEKECSKHAYVLVDVTAQKEVGIKLEKENNLLEELVNKRTLELQEKELRFHSLVTSSPNIIMSIDRDGLITSYSNKKNLNNETELMGKQIQSLVEEGSELFDKILKLFEKSKSFTADVKLLDSDMWLNLSAGPMDTNLATVIAVDI